MNFKCASIIIVIFINLNIICSCEETILLQATSKNSPVHWYNIINSTLVDQNLNLVTSLDNIYIRSTRDTIKTKCGLSKDMLVGLRSEIKETMKNITNTTNTSICTLNFDNADDCDSLVSLLQCGFNHILEEFNNPRQYSLSQSEYDVLKNACQRLNRTANSFKENAGRNDKQLLEKINILITLNTQLNNEKTEIFIQQTILLCASEIYSGRIESALKKYSKIEDPKYEHLNKIMEKSYMYTKMNALILHKVIEFVKRLPLAQMLMCFQKLFQTMGSITDESFSNYSENLLKNLGGLKNNEKTIMRNWESQIRSSSLKQSVEYSEIYNNLLKKFITDIFFSRLDMEETLRFIADLPHPTHKIIGYEILLQIFSWIDMKFTLAFEGLSTGLNAALVEVVKILVEPFNRLGTLAA